MNTLNRYERFFSLHAVILQRIYSDTQNFPDSFPTLCVVQNLYFIFFWKIHDIVNKIMFESMSD